MAKLNPNNPLYRQFLEYRPKQSDLRLASIIESAIDCIATQGIEKLSFDAIGKPIKMTRAHVAYYFKNKNEIIESAIGFSIMSGQKICVKNLESVKDPKKWIETYIYSHFEWAQTHPKQMKVMEMFYYYASFKKNYSELCKKTRDTGIDRIIEILKPLLSCSPADLRLRATAIQNVLTGALIYSTSIQQYDELPRIQSETYKQVLTLLE